MALMNDGCHKELCELGCIEFDCTLSCKTDFCKYFCYFDSNLIAASLQLQLYLDANCVLVHERVKSIFFFFLHPRIWPKSQLLKPSGHSHLS